MISLVPALLSTTKAILSNAYHQTLGACHLGFQFFQVFLCLFVQQQDGGKKRPAELIWIFSINHQVCFTVLVAQPKPCVHIINFFMVHKIL